MSSLLEEGRLIDHSFQQGREVVSPWRTKEEGEKTRKALSTLGQYLSESKVQQSFEGMDQMKADRQSFWVASTGLHNPLYKTEEEFSNIDGDNQGGLAGIEALRVPQVSQAIGVIKDVLDAALEAPSASVGISAEMLQQVTIRYRAIRYEAIEREVAGIGLHPDGNVLSALVTDNRGLFATDGNITYEPSIEGVIVMPGSILYRWSGGIYKPTFHRVEVPKKPKGDPPKISVVGFFNFPDKELIPTNPRFGLSSPFYNDVIKFKSDDMDANGDLAHLWRQIGAS